MTIPLQTKIIYGPLKSRRFGTSLGVNLLPNDQKVCNFDCVYCQYSRSEFADKAVFPTLQEIETETASFLKEASQNGSAVDWLTIAGNGEPTLHPQFREAVACLLSVRDRWMPALRVGILSNASTCHRPEVRRALELLDGRFMKLDAGSSAMFKEINRPGGSGGWGEMVAGLRDMKHIVLQSLFFDGNERNIAPSQVYDWIELVKRIQPRSVQIYTIDRPTRLDGLRRVPMEILQRIANDLTAQTGIPGEVY